MTERPKIVSLAEWRAQVAEKKPPVGVLLVKALALPPQFEASERKAAFTLSNGDLDRDGDTIDPSGWDLSAYHKNPVVLWSHDSGVPPVGKSVKTWVADGALRSVCEFPPAGVHALADTVYGLLKGGFLNATSVGFMPTDYEPSGKGFRFKGQELFEYSILPIPSNRSALVEAKRAGLAVAPVVDWAKSFVESAEAGLWLPVALVKDALREYDGPRVTVPAVSPEPRAAGAATGDHATAGTEPPATKMMPMADSGDEDATPKTTNEILAEEQAERDLMEQMWKLEDAFRESIRSIVANADAKERAGLIQTSTEQFATQYAALASRLPKGTRVPLQKAPPPPPPPTPPHSAPPPQPPPKKDDAGAAPGNTQALETKLKADLDKIAAGKPEEAAAALKDCLETFAVEYLRVLGALPPEGGAQPPAQGQPPPPPPAGLGKEAITFGDLFKVMTQEEAAAVWLPRVRALKDTGDGIDRATMANLCPRCAERMERAGVSHVKLAAIVRAAVVEKDMPGGMPKASADALCDKWGDDEGGFSFTSCDQSKIRDAMEDPEGFCAALHKYCTGLWPTEKPKTASPAAVRKYITHEGDKWIVHAEDGKVLGTHDSEKDAKAQLAAVEANKHKRPNVRRGMLVLEKVGRVLSAANEATLRGSADSLQTALAALQAVLALVEDEIEEDAAGEGGDGVSGYHAGEGVILPAVTQDAPPAVEKIQTPFGEMTPDEVREGLSAALKEVQDRERMRTTGRLPD